MNALFDQLFGEATRLTHGGHLLDATAAIQRILSGADPAPYPGVPPADSRQARVKPAPSTGPAPVGLRGTPYATFEEGMFTGATGARDYKLFIPAGAADRGLPLVVMLHGCTQSPDDFAAGTRMNEVARERGFLVLYPAQAPRSNSSKCWNWFQPSDQCRGGGEPELLAAMTRHIMQIHGVDPTRVHVAGLSAGGAMADILGREYPDLFASVAVHSGVPKGGAHDMASAFAVMRSGSAGASLSGGSALMVPAARPGSRKGARLRSRPAPAIVFHGDCDTTVHPSNGDALVDALATAFGAPERLVVTREKKAQAGRAVTRTVHHRAGAGVGEPSVVEHWIVHGAGHAWSGGSTQGSYTETIGPDATREMVRFFEEHPRRAV